MDLERQPIRVIDVDDEKAPLPIVANIQQRSPLSSLVVFSVVGIWSVDTQERKYVHRLAFQGMVDGYENRIENLSCMEDFRRSIRQFTVSIGV